MLQKLALPQQITPQEIVWHMLIIFAFACVI